MERKKQSEENKSNRKWLLLLLLLLLLLFVAIGVTIWALFFRAAPMLAPDYAPRQQEAHAEEIGGADEEKLPQAQGGGAVSLSYTTDVRISLLKQQATLYFANPSKSNQDMVLQIVVQDTVLAQSGTIAPGRQVKELDLLKDAAQKLSPGGYEGKFAVFYYQPDTHEKTIVNTEIPVQITVE